jgi:hypothetical protein
MHTLRDRITRLESTTRDHKTPATMTPEAWAEAGQPAGVLVIPAIMEPDEWMKAAAAYYAGTEGQQR